MLGGAGSAAGESFVEDGGDVVCVVERAGLDEPRHEYLDIVVVGFGTA